MSETNSRFNLARAASVTEEFGKKSPIEFRRLEPMPGVVPSGELNRVLAMDSTPYEMMNQNVQLFALGGQAAFVGYPALAALAQKSEYSNAASVLADEMTRKWISLSSDNSGDQEDIAAIEAGLVKFDIKRLIYNAVRCDALFGIAHIYVDTGADDVELATPLTLSDKKITTGSVIGFKIVEPMWCYPSVYNSTNPLQDYFFKPREWFVMGQVVHESRFIDIVSRPVPDMLKPSYNFGGLSITQLMMPYVDAYIQTRDNVVDLIKTVRMRVISTDLDGMLADAGVYRERVNFMQSQENNLGILFLNRDEEIKNHSTPLTDLSNLLGSFQSQMCMPMRTVDVKLMGSRAGGLGSSGESEVNTWHETISGMQEKDLRHAIGEIIKIISLNELGRINDRITFEFNSMVEIDEMNSAEIDYKTIEAVDRSFMSNMITTDEAREALSKTAVFKGGLNEGVSDEEFLNGKSSPEAEADSVSV